MSTTNSRNIRDDVADEPTGNLPENLTLGSEAIIDYQGSKANKKTASNNNSDDSNDDLPPEYRGKSPADLVKMLSDKEAMIGRQANELGHLRDLSNQLLSAQVSQSQSGGDSQSQPSRPEITSDDILDNPTDAISRIVAPLISQEVNKLQEAIGTVNATSAAERFEKDHPTYKQDMENPEFQKFIQSSKYRSKLAQRALQESDFDAADELWIGWEERQSSASSQNTEDATGELTQDNQQNSKNLQDAVTIRGGGNDAAHASQKPIYSAVKLQEFRNRDPDAYYNPTFQRELIQAFREKRVR